MAFPLAQAARTLANDYRQQASQIQSMINANGCTTNLGFVDFTNYHMLFPRALIPQNEEAQKALWDAKSALSALADVVDLWANDIERILQEAIPANPREARNTRRAEPY